MPDTSLTLVIITLTFLLAGTVKGAIGMGLPTVAMGLLGLVMAPVHAAALLIVPSLVTNVWQLAIGPNVRLLVRRLGTMMLGICLGTVFGLSLLTGGASHQVTAALGAVLAAYGLLGLLSPRYTVPARAEPWLSPLVGSITGLLSGATGVFVIPAVPYLGSLGLDKDQLIQALGLSFTVSTIALAIGLALHGEFRTAIAGSSLLALIPALAGMYLGQHIRDRLEPQTFRRWFFSGLLVLGVYMVVRAVRLF